MKSVLELIFLLCVLQYFFGFPVDLRKAFDSNISVSVDCPKEAPKQEPKKDDSGPSSNW